MKTVNQLLDRSKISVGLLETALEQSCPKAIEWCERVETPLPRRGLCKMIIENLDHPLRITFEECIVRRWLPQQKVVGPARFDVVLRPSLDFVELGRISLRLAITAAVELVPRDPAAQVTVDKKTKVLLLPAGGIWTATLRLSIRDPDRQGAGTEFHAIPEQDVYLTERMSLAGATLPRSPNGAHLMNPTSYVGKTYIVDNADARVRHPDDLLQHLKYQQGEQIPQGKKVGDFKIIPRGTRIRVTNARGASKKITFVYAEDAGSNAQLGWTSVANLTGRFVNETIGEVDPVGDDELGPNAAWRGGEYIGQKTLVQVVGEDLKAKRIVLETAAPYFQLATAAASDGITISITSGFRTYSEQDDFYRAYLSDKDNEPEAAKPGRSHHQHGQAFDLNTGDYEAETYKWLTANGPRHGFIRTVSREPWHWEYRPDEAEILAERGEFKTANVDDTPKPVKK